MAIEGLKNVAEPQTSTQTDEIGAAVEALELLGLVEDRDRVTETVTADFSVLDKGGVAGEKFIKLPNRNVSLPEMIVVLDSGNYKDTYPETYVDDNIWTPGAHPKGYKAEDIGNSDRDQRADTWPSH